MKHFIMLVFLCSIVSIKQSSGQSTSTSYNANTLNIAPIKTVSIGLDAGVLGMENVFLGYRSGDNFSTNTFNSKNILIGSEAGRSAASSSLRFSRNVSIGYFSMANAESVLQNVAIGQYAGLSIKDASFNFFLGANAGQFGNNISSNVMIGEGAGAGLTNSGGNVIIGSDAAKSSSNINLRDNLLNNIFVGRESGGAVQGDNLVDNICIGNDTGRTLVDSGQNIFIGSASGENCQGNGNIFIGHNSGKTAGQRNNTLIINNANDVVTPLVFGDFSSKKLGINTSNLVNSIGTIDLTAYSLYVEGGLLSDEVRVRSTWADYVFDSGYELLSLENLKTFIQEYNHLPNMPTEEEVLAEGIELGDITKRQQEKIEELTLYLIEQNDKINNLEALLLDLQKDIGN